MVGHKARALFVAATLGCSGGAARASGFLAAEFGGEQGHPTTDDLTAMYFNPAGLALGSGTRIGVSGLLGIRHIDYTRPPDTIDHITPRGSRATGTPEEAISANAGVASLTNLVGSAFAGAASDFGVQHFALGMSVYAPFGGAASWNRNKDAAYGRSAQYAGALDGVQRWSVIDGTSQSFYITVAGSYYIPRARLAVGLGVNLVVSKLDLTRARNADGSDSLVTSSGALQEGRSWINVDNITASLGVGLLWRPLDNLWAGASYQSQPGFGELTYSGTLNNKLGAAAPAEQKVELKQSLPDVLRAGLRWRPIWNVELRVNAEYARWSVFDKQCILDASDARRSCRVLPSGALDTAAGGQGVILNVRRNWKDAYRVHGGASYWVLDVLEIFAGVSFDSNVVPDATIDAALIDMDKVIVDGGARLELKKGKLAIAGTYSHFLFLDRDVAARPRDPSGTPITAAAPSRNPDGGGRYAQTVGLFTLTGQYRF